MTIDLEEISSSKKTELSERELEILRLVAAGAGNKQIAQRLSISANTVKVHLRNIYAKIGVASRTEAAMHAVQHGLIEVAVARPMVEASGITPQVSSAGSVAVGLLAAFPANRYFWAVAVLLLAVLLIVGGWVAVEWRARLVPAPSAASFTLPSRWHPKAELSVPRRDLAVVTYANQIYAIGGMTAEGVTDLVERYDPRADAWERLSPKPAAVAEIGAAVIGGRIYVAGGRLAGGVVTDTLEIYDPAADSWKRGAPLPAALSSYAIAAFEGRLYIFGGWDGRVYTDTVYEYDPTRDFWTGRTALPTARGYAGAAATVDGIYVVGGYDGAQALAVNEFYRPDSDRRGEVAWQTRTPLPRPIYRMGLTSIADIIHLVGGVSAEANCLLAEYFPPKDEWLVLKTSFACPWTGLGLTAVETYLHAVGGEMQATPAGTHWAYEAIYTIAIPVIAP